MAIDVVTALEYSRGITQTPSFEKLEEIIDNRLNDPLFRRIVASDRFRENVSTSAFEIRLPDATIVEPDVLEKLKAAYQAVGWGDVLVKHGDTQETEYQVRIVLMYGVRQYQKYKETHHVPGKQNWR